ncbi:MAG: class I SAM-dependent methyltransferase [Candidatus Edwardsbacteria bacterium]|nr:class I SAM-dependent methyltransferase [Candidatus Edwardsbacteria bacterium]
MHDPIHDQIALIKPGRALEVGCGCGDFTVRAAPHCGHITAVEPFLQLIEWCNREHARPNVDYLCMDGRRLEFPDRSFDLAYQRSSLHHVLEWHKVVDEMARVSSQYILLEEPLDDTRTPEKQNAILGQELLLELQNEVGYPHYKHLTRDALQHHLGHKRLPAEYLHLKNDNTVSFEQFFHTFETFVQKSRRPDYWRDRLEEFRGLAGSRRFAENDLLFVIVSRR